MNSKKIIIIASIALVVLAIVGGIYISTKGHEKTDNAQIDASIIPVRSIVSGFVIKVNFHDNQTVKQGDTLALIDPTDYLAKVAQAEAALESAKAQSSATHSGASAAGDNAEASNASRAAAEANIRAAQARTEKASRDQDRAERLLKANAITQQQYDAYHAEFLTAKAQETAVIKQSEASKFQSSGAKMQANAQSSQVNLANAVIKQREAELALAKSQLANTVIKAPCNGIVSKKAVEVGQYLQISTAVCSCVDTDNFWVSANFKETQISKMKIGNTVAIKIDAFEDMPLEGSLESFGGATGAKFSLLPADNSTGNFVKITQRVPVRIKLNKLSDEQKTRLVPGLSVNVDVHTQN